MAEIISVLLLLGFWGTLLILYFIPSYLAYRREHTNFVALFVLNLFAGWTMLGWVAALVWALYRDPKAD